MSLARVAVADDSPVPADVVCGDDYWISATAPDGWQETIGGTLQRPIVQWASGTELAIAMHVRTSAKPIEPSAADPERVLREQIEGATVFGLAGRIQAADRRHPSFPSAAARITGKESHIELVSVVAVAERNRQLDATFVLRSKHPASSGDQARFQAAIDSFRADPKLGCKFGPDRKLKRVQVVPGEPLPQAEIDAASPNRDFAIGSAGRGLDVMSRMFVPVTTRPVSVDGKPALVVDFRVEWGRKGRTREYYVDEFATMAASTWCWEAESAGPGAEVPSLFFAGDDPQILRRWDCSRFELGSPEAVKVSELPREAIEKLTPPGSREREGRSSVER